MTFLKHGIVVCNITKTNYMILISDNSDKQQHFDKSPTFESQ